VYRESTWVPLLLRPPDGPAGEALRGRRVPWTVSLLDLPPTLLAALGAAVPPSWQGRDLLGELLGGGPAEERAVLAESEQGETSRLIEWRGERLVTTGSAPRVEWYAAAEDPGDLRPRYRGSVGEDRGREAAPLLGRALQEFERLRAAAICEVPATAAPPPGPALRETLRSLGYVGGEGADSHTR
jgi:arylsulfatase A-like enzyme